MTEKEADDVIADLRKNFDKDGDGIFSYAGTYDHTNRSIYM